MSVQPTEDDVEPELPAPSRPEQQFEVETCSISRWRGYVTSSFTALLDDGTPVAKSAEFRCRGRAEPPDEGAVRDAYDELRVELQRLGWEETEERSHSWYANRFTRLTDVPVDTAPQAEAAVETSTLHVLEAAPAVEPERSRLREAPAPPTPQRVEPPVERNLRRVEATLIPSLPAQRAGETPQRSRTLTIISVLGIIGALVVGAYLAVGQGGGQTLRHVTIPVSAAKPTPVVATATPVPKPAAAKVRLSITAGGRASWLEIRRGSATGTVLFTGELAAGQSLRLNGKRLWARFGAARNLTIRANGRLVTFMGTFEHVFTAAKK
jgi:Domain of unknown function (DUF4115)